MSDLTPVYFHDCPALGKHAKVIKAYRGDKAGTVLYGWQYKCPFCSYTVGEFHAEPSAAAGPPQSQIKTKTKDTE